MGKAKHIIFSLLLTLVLNFAIGQAVYDVRLNAIEDPICPDVTLFLDIEIKAADVASEFNLSEQNYRFSFNRDALANPTKDQELTVSGFVGGSFYNTHTLTGSLDTVVSYNIELAGGAGYPITADTWVPVGRMAFDIVDANACLNLKWHELTDFPTTYIGEVRNGVRGTATGNNYAMPTDCITDLCNLPVELVSFIGEEDNCEVHLSWTTATEENSDYFEVQRSWDGLSFQEIGRVQSAGNSNIMLNYNFTDTEVGLTNYYRLKQVDFDGAVEYSEIIRVNSECFEPGILSDIMEVYPNPAGRTDNMNVKLYTRIDEAATILIYDTKGRVMSQVAVELTAGPNLLDFSVANLPSGTYILRVRGESWSSAAQKFVKISP